jgi:RNA polymerase sigma factor (sigma-70 family)
MVLAVCRSRLRDPQAAEDAAQETFLNAHRSLLGGTQPRDPAAWLATIARNECSRLRRMARPAPLDEDTAASQLDPADIVAGRAELTDVSSAIAALPARQREALVLREFCGLSYDQIAAAMSVSGSAVDALLARARRRIVEQLGEIPRATHGILVVPAALREELARLIPGLDAAGAAGAAAGAGAGAGGLTTLLSLGSAPVGAKVAATCAATVALAVPLQATVRDDETRRSAELAANVVARDIDPRPSEEDRTEPKVDSSGHGSGGALSSGHGSDSGPGGSRSGGSRSGSHGSGSSGSGSEGSESGSSGSGGSESGSSGSGSSGSGSSGSGSGSGGSGSSGSGSGSSGSGSASGGSGSSGSGSSGSGSGSGGSGSSGSGSGSSGSGSTSEASGGSGSDSSGSGSDTEDSSGSGSGGSDSDSSGSGSGDSGSGSSDDD